MTNIFVAGFKAQRLVIGKKSVRKPLRTKETTGEGKSLTTLEKGKLYNNTEVVLKNSNATPIRNFCDGCWRCCFCEYQCKIPAELKKHTLEEHSDPYDMRTASFTTRTDLSKYYVKLDITELSCNICNENIDTIELLTDHLRKVHRLKIYTDFGNRMMPFKFESDTLTCFMCSNTFLSFRKMGEHMNSHYRNFICEVCDAGFMTRSMAMCHLRIHPKIGTLKCQLCPMQFDTSAKKQAHEKSVHGRKSNMSVCRYCHEKFQSYDTKVRHLKDVHKIDFGVKCQACDRKFSFPKKLSEHVRKHHLVQRTNECQQCDMKFFSKEELRMHMHKHSGLKLYHCDECDNSYSRPQSLRLHKRSHKNE